MKFYCPYCIPKYIIRTCAENDNPICYQCGEEMIKQPIIKIKQIVSLLITFAIMFPILYVLISSINIDRNKYKLKYEIYSSIKVKNIS